VAGTSSNVCRELVRILVVPQFSGHDATMLRISQPEQAVQCWLQVQLHCVCTPFFVTCMLLEETSNNSKCRSHTGLSYLYWCQLLSGADRGSIVSRQL
jgi:hypothetical protein